MTTKKQILKAHKAYLKRLATKENMKRKQMNIKIAPRREQSSLDFMDVRMESITWSYRVNGRKNKRLSRNNA